MTELEQEFKNRVGREFSDYYKEYKPKLTRYLTKYTKNIELSEEFANMAFIQGLEKIESYNNNLSQFITWVTSIAVNYVIKEYKDEQKRNHTSLDKEITQNTTLSTFLKYEDHKIENEEHDIVQIKSDLIKKTIYSLPDKYKKVMIMREIERKPYKEISDSIVREYNVTVTDDTYFIDNRYFKYATITNTNTSDVKININNKYGYSITLKPKEEKTIIKEDNNLDKIKIETNDNVKIQIVETTNLSTIKSQIKKGRFLIRKKVKKDFQNIDKNGIK
jgi:RNA polymerase sigma-70 factor (ECF subfamily)